jgi:LmbE family N-acetylglucosaminyl deacetylase
MDEPVQQLDVVAVGAHPDDLEIACGGTLAKLAEQGHRVGIIDLTDGEPTPLSPGPEVRLAEARRAAEVLGAKVRVTLDLPNRRLFDSFEARVALAKEFRKFRPRLVIGLGAGTPLASPDHYQAGMITEAAVFYSRLTKWEQYFGDLPVHTISSLLHCFLAFRTPAPGQPGGVMVDISDTLEKKIAAIACYQTQFPPAKGEHLERMRTLAREQGRAAGFSAGEMLSSPGALGAQAVGTRDLMGMLFGK